MPELEAKPAAEPAALRVLLAGGTGYIGAHVARALRRSGHQVLALRRPQGQGDDAGAPIDGAHEMREVDLLDGPALHQALRDEPIDAVISCIASRNGAPRDAWAVDHDANLNLLNVARTAGAEQFVLLSAICVQRPRLAFQHAKLAFEAKLQESGLRYSIVRPTAYFKSLAGQVARVQAGKSFLVFGKGTETACKPIGEADLAQYLIDCLVMKERANRILPIGGPGPAITPREQGQLLCTLAGQPVKISAVTPRIFDVALAVLGPLSRVLPPLAAKAEFARIGRYYATESMLCWDEAQQRYDADATPSTGTQTLAEFYRRILTDGLEDQALGAHKMF